MFKKRLRSRDTFVYVVMTVPLAILFFFFHTLPAIHGILLSFTDWNGFGPVHFIGLKNYIGLIHDPQVVHAYLFT